MPETRTSIALIMVETNLVLIGDMVLNTTVWRLPQAVIGKRCDPARTILGLIARDLAVITDRKSLTQMEYLPLETDSGVRYIFPYCLRLNDATILDSKRRKKPYLVTRIDQARKFLPRRDTMILHSLFHERAIA